MYNDENYEDIWDESDGDKITREAEEKHQRTILEYKRFEDLYGYFQGMYISSKQFVFRNADNISIFTKMLKLFLEKEEYEKCAVVRDWIEEIKAAVKEDKAKNNKKGKVNEILEKQIRF